MFSQHNHKDGKFVKRWITFLAGLLLVSSLGCTLASHLQSRLLSNRPTEVHIRRLPRFIRTPLPTFGAESAPGLTPVAPTPVAPTQAAPAWTPTLPPTATPDLAADTAPANQSRSTYSNVPETTRRAVRQPSPTPTPRSQVNAPAPVPVETPAAPAPAQGSEDSTEHHMDATQTDEEHAMEHDMDGMEYGTDGRVPNNGAVVRIVAPAAGAEIQHGSDVVVKIETDNFELGTDGNHWHIFVDGQSRGMITGVDYDEVVRGLEPGEHELGAYLSNGAHEELEDGAMITITVVE